MNDTLTIPRKKKEFLSFKAVPVNALFLADDDTLCQKVGPNKFNIIANHDGDLFADQLEWDDDNEYFVKEIFDIKKILLA